MFGLDPESSVTRGLMRSWGREPDVEALDAPAASPIPDLPPALMQMMGAS